MDQNGDSVRLELVSRDADNGGATFGVEAGEIVT